MKRFIPILVAIAGALAAARAARALHPAQTRTIVVSARQYAFDPPRIHVNQGDEVHIQLVSEDVVHGFFVEGYGINETIVPQAKNQEVVFTATKRGKYRYRCSQTCGTMHPFMTGEMIVGPNTPLHLGLGGIVGLAAGLMIFFGLSRRKGESE